MKLICKGSLIAALLFAAQMPVQADPAKAEDDCYNMAVYYAQAGKTKESPKAPETKSVSVYGGNGPLRGIIPESGKLIEA